MSRPMGDIEDRYDTPELLMPDSAAELANDPCPYIRGDRFREEPDTHTPKPWLGDQPTEPAPWGWIDGSEHAPGLEHVKGRSTRRGRSSTKCGTPARAVGDGEAPESHNTTVTERETW